MTSIYRICVLHTRRDYFCYSDAQFNPKVGCRVWVPFRKKIRLGIVLGQEQETPSFELKAIQACLDETALIDTEMMHLCLWIANYYQAPLSEVLPLALPKKYRLGLPCQLPLGDYYELLVPKEQAQPMVSKQAKKQLALIELLSQHKQALSLSFLKTQGFNPSHFLPLLAAQIIALSQKTLLPEHAPQEPSAALDLNEEQQHAVNAVLSSLDSYQSFFLYGVTGSGKTEVYLQIIAQVLQRKKQVLILVPEIGLTPQLLARFTARFQTPMVVLHSNLNESLRQEYWQLARDNQVQMVIGTRSALFTPFANLGLIIIDEAHDSSLKQMDGARYCARDTAIMRAFCAKIPIILGSATPNLESIHNCQQKKHTLLRLQHKALNSAPLHIQLIDLRAQTLQEGLSAHTINKIEAHLNNNNQVLVFINRRGYAPVLLCHQCAYMADCRACDTHLTFHKKTQQLICHHCGWVQKAFSSCPSCQSKELIPLGAGTQRIYEFLSARFPQVSVARIDSDEVTKKNALSLCLDKISRGETQLIIGTQMLAKGHHFPRLSLVVVVDADGALYNQDFRATEHLGQLLTQVAGRAGRAHHPGEVLIQTHLPQHPLLNTLLDQGFDAFTQCLLETRSTAQLPPYWHLALIRAQQRQAPQVRAFLETVKQQLAHSDLSIMGPAPAPLARKANQYRMQLLIKSSSRTVLNQALSQLRLWLAEQRLGSVRWNIDVDPISLA